MYTSRGFATKDDHTRLHTIETDVGLASGGIVVGVAVGGDVAGGIMNSGWVGSIGCLESTRFERVVVASGREHGD